MSAYLPVAPGWMFDPGHWSPTVHRLAMAGMLLASGSAAWWLQIGPGMDAVRAEQALPQAVDHRALGERVVTEHELVRLRESIAVLSQHRWPVDSGARLLLALQDTATRCGARIEVLRWEPARKDSPSHGPRVQVRLHGRYLQLRAFLSAVRGWPYWVAWEGLGLSSDSKATSSLSETLDAAQSGAVTLDATVAAFESKMGGGAAARAAGREGQKESEVLWPSRAKVCGAEREPSTLAHNPFESGEVLQPYAGSRQASAPTVVGVLEGASGSMALVRVGSEVRIAAMEGPGR